MRRRKFIGLVGGAAVGWPMFAKGQQAKPMRRIGVLVGLAENDPEMKERLAGFRQGLEKLGWSEGDNVKIDYRFAPAGAQAHLLAKELVALQPDVIIAQSTPATAALKPETSTIPIVFAGVADPIGSGWSCSKRSRRVQFGAGRPYVEFCLFNEKNPAIFGVNVNVATRCAARHDTLRASRRPLRYFAANGPLTRRALSSSGSVRRRCPILT